MMKEDAELPVLMSEDGTATASKQTKYTIQRIENSVDSLTPRWKTPVWVVRSTHWQAFYLRINDIIIILIVRTYAYDYAVFSMMLLHQNPG